MDELVKAVDYLGNAIVALAQIVDANGMVSEQDAVRFNSYFAAFEKHMAYVEGSMRKLASIPNPGSPLCLTDEDKERLRNMPALRKLAEMAGLETE